MIVEQLQPSTAVLNAVVGSFVRGARAEDASVHRGSSADSPRQQLLANCGDRLLLWAESSDGSLELQQEFPLFEPVEHLELVPAALQLFGSGSCDSLLAFTADGRCSLLYLQPQLETAAVAAAHTGAHQPRLLLKEAASLCLPLPPLQGPLLPKRMSGPVASGVFALDPGVHASRADALRGVLVAAVHTGVLHVLTLHAALGEELGAADDEALLLCAAVPLAETPLCGLPVGECGHTTSARLCRRRRETLCRPFPFPCPLSDRVLGCCHSRRLRPAPCAAAQHPCLGPGLPARRGRGARPLCSAPACGPAPAGGWVAGSCARPRAACNQPQANSLPAMQSVGLALSHGNAAACWVSCEPVPPSTAPLTWALALAHT
jgi:hypothetical protein